MKFSGKQKIVLSAAIAMGCGLGVVGTSVIEPVWAANTDGFSDPEFENALRRHIEKRFFNLIDATEAQRTELDAILKQQVEDARPQREQIRQAAIELTQLMSDESVTDEQIVNKAHQLRDMRTKLMDARLSTALKVRAKLTKGQKQTLSDRIIGILTGNARRGLLRSML